MNHLPRNRVNLVNFRARGWLTGALHATNPQAVTAPNPSARKLLGIALIVLLIFIWAALVASLAPVIGKWPVLVQGAFYLVMGIVWIIPLKPLLRWTETGRWRETSSSGD
jgi:predicted membrane channel-forming protein YqfA (hemolysin III family)